MPKQNDSDPLADAMAELNKQYGEGTVIVLGSEEHQRVDAIPTGSLGLDQVTGVGGIPRGRVTEIYGPESSGKSTLALGVVANAQRAGLTAAYIDAEHAVDKDYATAIGVNTDALLFIQPDSGDQALVSAERLARSGQVGIIVIDSVPALVPQAEIDGVIGDAQIGLQARLMSQSMRIMIPVLARTNTACVFINQLREKIGSFGFGPSETQPGGRALKFYASLRLDIRRVQTLKNGTSDPHGNRVKVKAVKNKVGPPLRICEFDILFGQGIDWAGEAIDLGVDHALVRKNGAFYTLAEGEPAANGRDKARMRLWEQPELARTLYLAVKDDLAAGRTEPQVRVMHPDGPPTTREPRNLSAPSMTVAPDSV
jgi:recombination protein RecA